MTTATAPARPTVEQTKKNFSRYLRTLEGKNKTKYEKGAGALNTADGFCCLGVLCDIIPGVSWTPGSIYDRNGVMSAEVITPQGLRRSAHLLPERTIFRDWLGLPARAFHDANGDDEWAIRVTHKAVKDSGVPIPEKLEFEGVITVADLNDSGMSFPDIAKVLRLQYAAYLP